MTYLEFIKKIKKVPLTYQDYKEVNLSDDFIAQIIESFNPAIKNKQGLLQNKEDEVINLISNYDLTHTTIGMIIFFDAPVVSTNRVYFGKFEIDWLFVDLYAGEIKCCEEKSDRVLYRCAKNGGTFLAAIFEAACFLEKRSVNEELYNNEDIAVDVAKHCSTIAGGALYLDFYTVLLS